MNAERQLAELQSIYAALNIRSLVAIGDLSGKILSVNENYCKLSEYSEKELVGRNFNTVSSKSHPKSFWQDFWATLSMGSAWRGEICNRSKSGKLYWVDAIITPLQDENGRITRFLSFSNDISATKSQENELKKSNKLLVEMENLASVGGWELDVVNQQLYWTDRTKIIHEVSLNYEPQLDEAVNFYADQVNQQRITELVNLAISEGKEFDEELQIKTAKGNVRWVRTMGKAEFDKGVCTRLYGAFQDIHHQKVQRLEADKVAQRLKLATNNADVGIWELDLITGQLFWNEQMFKLYDLSKEQFDGTYNTWVESLSEDVRESTVAYFQSAAAGNHPFDTEFKIPTKDGRVRYIRAIAEFERDAQGNHIRVAGTNWDITRERLSEHQLRFSRNLLEQSSIITRIGGWELDLQSNELIISDMLRDIHEVPKDYKVRLRDALRFFEKGETRKKMAKAYRDAVLKAKSWDMELKLTTYTGAKRWIRSIGKVEHQSGTISKLYGTYQDISEQKANEKLLLKAKEEADAANKAKSLFLANMSHEIRTPLNGVIGFTELLSKTELDVLQKQYVNNAINSAQTLLSVLNDILDFSKIEAGKLELDPKETDLLYMLQSVTDIFKYAAQKKGLELLIDIEPGLPAHVMVDEVRLKQVLSNLLSNAVKFTAQGQVRIQLSHTSLAGKTSKARYHFSVEDTGIGIRQEQQSRLFKAFAQADSSTNRKYGGTGLGLVISNLILDQMKSELKLSSTEGKGSVFSFDLELMPLKKAPQIEVIESIKSVLVVDDYEENLVLLKGYLEHWGLEVTAVTSGIMAVSVLEKDQHFDLIIMDYQMPYIDGIESLRIIRDRLMLKEERLPAILLHSAIDDSRILQQSISAGIKYRLSKPITPNVLYETLLRVANLQTENTRELSVKKDQEIDAFINPRVLIAEDVALNATLVEALIKRFLPLSTISLASNGEEALSLYKNEPFDLIIMDIQMPVMDGFECSKQIRLWEKLHQIPASHIIALTAHAFQSDQLQAFESGMQAFVAKPIEPQVLRETLVSVFKKNAQKRTLVQPTKADLKDFDRESALSRTLNDEELLQTMVRSALTSIESELQTIQLSIDQQEFEQVKLLAHKIKGISRNLSFERLAKISADLEQSPTDDPTQMRIQLNMMEKAFQALQAVVKP